MFKKKDEEQLEDEIISMAESGYEKGLIDEDQVEMISNVLDLDDSTVHDIMTSRSKIYAVSKDDKVGDVITKSLDSGYSRYPVYGEDIDNIVGIIHFKDMTKAYLKNPDTVIGDIMNEAMYIHPAYDVSKLLEKMRNEKKHMAIILDEYGQTEGLITLEDVMEEIVGDIIDEHDKVAQKTSIRYGDTYVVDGMMRLHDLEELIEDLEFPDTDIETLNGFLLYKLGGFPKSDEKIKIDYGGYVFEPVLIEDRLIKKVRINKQELIDENI